MLETLDAFGGSTYSSPLELSDSSKLFDLTTFLDSSLAFDFLLSLTLLLLLVSSIGSRSELGWLMSFLRA